MMTVLAELAAALIAVMLATDGLRKLLDAGGFVRWLRTGGMTWLAHRELVYALAALEVAVGVASLHPVGRLVAIGVIVSVTPIGVLLVRRTGVCACRGVIRSNSPQHLVIRNAAAVLTAAASLLVLKAPVTAPAVLAVGGAWIIGLAGHHLLLTKAVLEEVR